MPAMGWNPGVDVEVASLHGSRKEYWLYRRRKMLAHGYARNRLTLDLAVRFALLRHGRIWRKDRKKK